MAIDSLPIFHCAATFVRHARDPTPIIAETDWHGYIIRTPKGHNGFGYDPVFYLPQLNCTVARVTFGKQKSIEPQGFSC